MRTKHICVLIHFRIKYEVGTTCLSPTAEYLLTVPKWYFLWIIFVIYVSRLPLYIVLSVPCGLVVCSALVYDVSLCLCHFPIKDFRSGALFDCIDFCFLLLLYVCSIL